jgi:hypothetical protein
MKRLFSLFLILTSSVIFAQEKFSDETIQKFADAYSEIRVESNLRQLNLVSEIEKTGLTMKQFTDIHMKLKDSTLSAEVTNEEIKKYRMAKQNIEKFEKDTQKMYETIINQKGLTIETYQAISLACEQDKAFNEKVMLLVNK